MGEISATSSAVALTTALRSGVISARDLLETYLERIDRLDRDGVNAVVTVDADRARRAAATADDARARGEVLGAYEVPPGFA
jgi:amidase